MRSYTQGWGAGFAIKETAAAITRVHVHTRGEGSGRRALHGLAAGPLRHYTGHVLAPGVSVFKSLFIFSVTRISPAANFITVAVSTARVRLAWRLGPLGHAVRLVE